MCLGGGGLVGGTLASVRWWSVHCALGWVRPHRPWAAFPVHECATSCVSHSPPVPVCFHPPPRACRPSPPPAVQLALHDLRSASPTSRVLPLHGPLKLPEVPLGEVRGWWWGGEGRSGWVVGREAGEEERGRGEGSVSDGEGEVAFRPNSRNGPPPPTSSPSLPPSPQVMPL